MALKDGKNEELAVRWGRNGLWASDPPPDSVRRLGSAWLDMGESAVLAVPSAIVPLEYNFLINPRHEDFPRIRIGAPDEFRFDPRRGTATRLPAA